MSPEDGAQRDPVRKPVPERRVAVCFVISILAALGLAVVYITGGQPQLEGGLLGVALGGIGIGLVLWAKLFLPSEKVVGAREPMESPEDVRRAADEALEAGEAQLARRPLLVKLLLGAAGAFGLAALFPIRSLGPSPGRALLETEWAPGLRLVDTEGRPIKATDLKVGGVLTVFPEGKPHADDAQAILIRVEPNDFRPRPGRENWAPQGNVAYSKICTHAGCPVGLYRTSTHQLLCPCHQSAFDVLDGANPVFGPAARPLPQLPISVDRDGYLVAEGDFSQPVGPGFWEYG